MSDRERPQRTREPNDRLTRICDAMTNTLESHPEHIREDKGIIFLDDGKRGGIVLHGYDDDLDAMTDLFAHLKAIFEANGMTMLLAPLGGSPERN